jgi:hypothetical protein
MAEEQSNPEASISSPSELESGSTGESPRAALPEDVGHIEDKGAWLFVSVKQSSGSVPVRIAREAMENHFGAGGDNGKGLIDAYLEHSSTINAKVLELAPSGQVYSADDPMRLGAGDFL